MPLDPRIPLQIQHFDVGPAIDEYYRSVDNKRRTNAQKLADMAAQQQLELNEAEISEMFRKRKEAEELRKILGEAYGLEPEGKEGHPGGGFQGYPDEMGRPVETTPIDAVGGRLSPSTFPEIEDKAGQFHQRERGAKNFGKLSDWSDPATTREPLPQALNQPEQTRTEAKPEAPKQTTIPGHLSEDQIRRIGRINPEMAGKIRREQQAEVFAAEKATIEQKKGDADLIEKQFAIYQKRMDASREMLVGILNIPEADRPEAYQRALFSMQKMGIDIGQMPPRYNEAFVKEQVAGLASFARTLEQRRQEEAEKRAQGEYDATIGGKRAESESKVRTNEFAGKDPDNLTPEQRAAQKRAKEAQESAERRFREGQSAADRRAAAGRAVTMRGQDIADQRAKREPADKVTQGALKDLANLDTALESLGSLRKVIEANPDKMGPVSGRLRQIPWLGASRQIVNADIERVRQEVGRAMEGGVLRKEDEEKYKRILPAMEDLPEVARYKLDQLEAKLKQDIQKYVGRQQEGQRGRDLSAPARPRMGASEDGFVFMGGDPGDKKNWKRAK